MRWITLSLLFALQPLAAAPPIKDDTLGLSKASVFTAPAPPAYRDEASAPGEKPRPRRANREAPPVIPHGVADFLPITRAANACVDCHGIRGPKRKGEPTPIPDSHYRDLRRDPDRKGEQIAGTRYICVSCHVPRTDAPPLLKP